MNRKSNTRKVSRTQARAIHTRKRILDAALQRFAQYGADATTIEDITETADIGKGTFYLHFADKSELLSTLLEQTVNNLIRAITKDSQVNRSFEKTLEQLLAAHVQHCIRHQDEFILLFQGRLMLKLTREVNAEIEPHFQRYLEVIAQQLSSHVPHPIDTDRLHRLSHSLTGFVSGFLSFAMIGMSRRDMQKSLRPMRKAFVSAARAFLVEQDTGAIPVIATREPGKENSSSGNREGSL